MKGFLIWHSLDGNLSHDFYQDYEVVKEVIEDNKAIFGNRYEIFSVSKVEEYKIFNNLIG